MFVISFSNCDCWTKSSCVPKHFSKILKCIEIAIFCFIAIIEPILVMFWYSFLNDELPSQLINFGRYL
jgi:hypothetical protein